MEYLEVIAMFIGAFSALSALTPTMRDDEAVTRMQKLFKVVTDAINLFALNVGGAKPVKGAKGLVSSGRGNKKAASKPGRAAKGL